ncbi:hypothetical protein HY256_06375, partial [Candidatus Sumerlaeota bacterium]|nr:hypothetical protein [Candidatus Sumerlaeota bacterium]
MASRLSRCLESPKIRTALLSILMAALVWNSLRYPIRRGFDSGAHRRYAEYIFDHGRLPGFEDTYVAYNPPLFYLCAAAIRFANEHIPFGPSLNTPDKATRVLMAILTCLWLALSVRLCGEILGERTKTPYLLFLGAMPGFFKISAMFTPEILLTALIWIGLGLLMRSWGRDGKISRRAALLYGLFLFLAAWTRPFGVAPLAAMSLSFPYFILRDRVNWRNWVVPAAIILGIGGAGMLSSLEFNQLRFGKSMPLPYDQQPLRRLPPLSFYFGIDPGAMLTRPVRPSFGQTSIPVFYSDLWGDYWRYWILADAERPSNRDHKSAKGTGFSKLDRRWIPLLGVQNLLALYPTLLMSGGLLMLIVRAFRSR